MLGFYTVQVYSMRPGFQSKRNKKDITGTMSIAEYVSVTNFAEFNRSSQKPKKLLL